MNINELLDKLAENEIKLEVNGEKLKAHDPLKKLDDALLEQLKTHKEALLKILTETKDFTLSDFPHITSAIDQARLDQFQRDYPNLERLYMATPMQQGLIFLGIMEGNGATYTTQIYMEFTQVLSSQLFKRAWEYVAGRHEVLRTCFVGFDSETVHQLVVDRVEIPLYEEDLRALTADKQNERIKQYTAHDITVGFDFTAPPLMRLSLFRLSEDHYHLLWSHHHSILDGWCLPIVLREVFATYQALNESRVPDFTVVRPYENYIAWLQKQDRKKARDFWQTHLKGIEAPTPLIIDKLPVGCTAKGYRELVLTQSAEISSALEALAREVRTTLSVIVQAAWAYVLHRYSGDGDVVFGSIISGRPGDLAGVETMIGPFFNVVPVRVSFDQALCLKDLLSTIHRDNIAREEYGYLSLAEVQSLSDLGGGASLFDSMCIYANYPTDLSTIVETTNHSSIFDIQSYGAVGQTNYKLTLFASFREGILSTKMTYRAEDFVPETIERLMTHFEQVLRGMATANITEPVHKLPLLSAHEEKQLLIDWNNTALDYEQKKCMHELFEVQAKTNPKAIALVYEGQTLTYGELNSKANQLAHYLLEKGVTSNTLVGVCLERSLEMVIGLFGVLKAGGAYVPLDPAYPPERIQFMLENSCANFLVTQQNILTMFPQQTVKNVLCLDDKDFWTTQSSVSTENLDKNKLGLTSNHLAYVIYTSGSTGKPKGVKIHHKSVMNLFKGLDQEFGSSKGQDTWLAVTSICFDISVLEIFWTLSNGNKVILAAEPAIPISQNQNVNFSLFYFAAQEASNTRTYELLLEGAKFADQNGLAAVWVPERHFSQIGHQFPNPSVAAAAVAVTTDKIKIRAGSVVLPLHDPIRVAEEWSMVDNLSYGRVELSIASGWHPNDFVLMPDDYVERHEKMKEKLSVLKNLWQGQKLTRRNGVGKDYDVLLHPKPIQKDLTLWITAAINPETFRYAGSIGANLLTHLLGQSHEELKEKISIYRDALEKAGYSREQGKIALMLHTFISNDINFVEKTVEKPFKNYLNHSFNLVKAIGEDEGLDIEKDKEAIIEIGYKRYLREAGLFGTPESCFVKVQQLQACGVDEIACLIDFGIDCQTMLSSLPFLAQLQKQFQQQTAQLSLLSKRLKTVRSPQELIRQYQVTHMQCTPTYVRQWMSEESSQAVLGQLSQLLVGGEALPTDLAELLSKQVAGRVFNMYGPTETTVWSAVSEVTDKNVRIGKPIANTQFYVLDKFQRLVPQGVIGELYIGGHGLSSGYFERPELTQQQYVNNPFSANDSDQLYKTGDLVRRLADGSLEFTGRVDQQVKVRGYRIELGEIEAALMELPEVKNAVVVVKQENENNSDNLLVAYVVPAIPERKKETTIALDQQTLTEVLRNALQYRIPNYMLPNVFILLDALPLTPNGKLNRKVLMAQDKQKIKRAKYDAPRDQFEQRLCTIFQDALKLERIGIYDNFFSLGGHSLLTVQMVLNINTQFPHTKIEIADVLANPTVVGLAQLLKVDAEKDFDPEIILENELAKFVYAEAECDRVGNYQEPEGVFITNITNLTGTHLLKNLLLKTNAKIYYLTSGGEEDGVDGIKSICAEHRIDIKANDWKRIESVAGALNSEHLGMSLSDYQKIISNVDIIMHNAEVSDYTYSYQQLKNENVNSTYELIKMAKLVKKKQFIFLSTTGLLSENSASEKNTDINSFSFRESQGYLASKWVAEAMIKHAGIDYKIHRLPHIGGNVGSANDIVQEHLYRFSDFREIIETT